jgi:hypothetical protein
MVSDILYYMPPELHFLLEKNTELLKENNRLLKKLYRYQVWGFWFTVLWYLVLIVSPLALYFYVLEPYMTAWNASYETFSTSLQEIPGFKIFTETLEMYKK